MVWSVEVNGCVWEGVGAGCEIWAVVLVAVMMVLGVVLHKRAVYS